MTKAFGVLAGLVCLLLAAPSAIAHGAAAAREIDTRLLADDEGAIAYGGCFNVEVDSFCAPGLEAEGLDLLVLEVREASHQSEPAVIFRIIYQADDARAGRTVGLTFKAAGKDQSYTFTTDGATAPTGTFDKVAGPFAVFDGYPKAVDAYLQYSTLGVKAGDQLTDIQATSAFEDQPSDAMPGTWYASGEMVPFVPAPEGATEVPPPATYTLKGPAKLLAITSDADPGATEVTLTVRNALAGMPQFVTLTAPTGVTLDNANLNLDGGATREVKATLASATTPAVVNVTSDLDHFEVVTLVEGTATPAPTTSATPSSTHDSNATASGHDESGTGSSKGAPMAPAGFVLVALAACAAALRRRI